MNRKVTPDLILSDTQYWHLYQRVNQRKKFTNLRPMVMFDFYTHSFQAIEMDNKHLCAIQEGKKYRLLPQKENKNMQIEKRLYRSQKPYLKCANCMAPASFKCSGCYRVLYCNETCQKRHWKLRHKLDCKKYYNDLTTF